MSETFFEHPILNSPYEYPPRHWELDDDGQPTNGTNLAFFGRQPIAAIEEHLRLIFSPPPLLRFRHGRDEIGSAPRLYARKTCWIAVATALSARLRTRT